MLTYDQHLYKSHAIAIIMCLWLLQIIIALPEGDLLLFFAIQVWKIAGLACDWFDLSSESGTEDLSA